MDSSQFSKKNTLLPAQTGQKALILRIKVAKWTKNATFVLKNLSFQRKMQHFSWFQVKKDNFSGKNATFMFVFTSKKEKIEDLFLHSRKNATFIRDHFENKNIHSGPIPKQ